MTTVEESPPTSLIAAIEDQRQAVTRMHASAGQDLVYPGHSSTGVWILLDGEVVSLHGGEGGRARRQVATPARPIVLVSLRELERPSRALLRVAEDSDLLHVGFSACVPGGAMRKQVEEFEASLAS